MPLPLFFALANAGIAPSLLPWMYYSTKMLPKRFEHHMGKKKNKQEIKIIPAQSNEQNNNSNNVPVLLISTCKDNSPSKALTMQSLQHKKKDPIVLLSVI